AIGLLAAALGIEVGGLELHGRTAGVLATPGHARGEARGVAVVVVEPVGGHAILGRRPSAARALEAVLPELAPQRGARDAELAGRGGGIALVPLEHARDVLALDLGERPVV